MAMKFTMGGKPYRGVPIASNKEDVGDDDDDDDDEEETEEEEEEEEEKEES